MVKGRQYILENSYLCLDEGYTFLNSTMHHLCEPEDLQCCGDNNFLLIQKGHHCTIVKAFISSVSNISDTIINLSQPIIILGMYCKVTNKYSIVQALFAPITNFGNDLKDIRRVLFKT